MTDRAAENDSKRTRKRRRDGCKSEGDGTTSCIYGLGWNYSEITAKDLVLSVLPDSVNLVSWSTTRYDKTLFASRVSQHFLEIYFCVLG
jgi:hypothetical protein